MYQNHKYVGCSAEGGLEASRIVEGNQWDPKVYMENAPYVDERAGPLIELLDPEPGRRLKV